MLRVERRKPTDVLAPRAVLLLERPSHDPGSGEDQRSCDGTRAQNQACWMRRHLANLASGDREEWFRCVSEVRLPVVLDVGPLRHPYAGHIRKSGMREQAAVRL